MSHRNVELLAIGAGPANLALAVALEEIAPGEFAENSLLIEQNDDVAWQRGMLLPWTKSQVSFLKDLVTMRNPRSRFSFVNYLHAVGRLTEFVNLGTFTPYRMEISDYLRWVANSLTKVNIEYGRRCAGIEPVRTGDGELNGWLVTLADGSTIGCRYLVLGTGRDPHVPTAFTALPWERVVHSTRFSTAVAELDPRRAYRIAVIGGAQSAAEMLWAAHQRFPRANLTMVMRSIGLNTYENSKFTNELFYPSFVDEFFAAPPEARTQLLREMRRTNYAGLSPDLLESLYQQMYLDRLNGTERIRIRTMTEVNSARLDDGEVVLTLADRRTGRPDELRCDVVLLGTGFRGDMPHLVRGLTARLGVDNAAVDRMYRLVLPSPSAAACYVQGVNEATHGIADSLLSVLAARAEEIVTDVLGHRMNRESFSKRDLVAL